MRSVSWSIWDPLMNQTDDTVDRRLARSRPATSTPVSRTPTVPTINYPSPRGVEVRNPEAMVGRRHSRSLFLVESQAPAWEDAVQRSFLYFNGE